MKRILYTFVVLSIVLFAGCREDQLEGEVPGKEVALTFSSRSADLSSEALSKEINKLHLLIFNEDGSFSQKKEFASLADVTPVKLPLGTYTFAYLSNIDGEQISGQESLDDIVVTLQMDANGDIILPGSIFSGTDKITVGEDKTSDASLSRMVGRLDVNVSGLKGGVELQSVTLLGSPKSVSFNGTPKDTKAQLKVPMGKDGELMMGQAVAFPTCIDSLARLEFVIVENGEIKTYVSTLKNKVEANKIHTLNAKVNIVGGVFDVDIQMSLEEWGATESEDITATQKVYIDSLKVKIVMEAMSLNVEQVKEIYMNFLDPGRENSFSVHGNKGEEYYGIDISGDTLILHSRGRVACGNYTMDYITIQDSSYNRLYALPAPVQNVVIDTTCCVVIVLPKMPDVAATDKAAVLELRAAMQAAGVEIPSSWKGDNINLWYEIELNAEGRVIGIGYSDLDDYEDDYSRNRVAKTAASANTASKAIARTLSGEQAIAWSLPTSFKELTALKCFNMSDGEYYGVLTEIPSFIKELSNLEELSVSVNSATLPELPAGLKYLEVKSKTLTQIPAHIGDLTQLQVLIIGVPDYEEDDEYDYDYLPLLSQASVASIEMDFGKLAELKALYLIGGANCEIPDGLWNLPGGSLRELGLYGFSRIQVPVSVSKWSVLEDLSLANAVMAPSDIEAIKNLNLTDLMIYSPVFGQSGLPAWLGGMSSIENLTLFDCGITSIPESFSGLTGLRDLDMPRNPNLTGILPTGLLERYNAGELYVYAPESKDFSPDGTWLEVTPERINVPVEGGVYEVEIKTDSEWTCSFASDGDCVTVIPGQGEFIQADSITGAGILTGRGNATLKVVMKEALYGSWRCTGQLNVRVGQRNTESVSIEQAEAKEERLETSVKDSCSLMAGDMFVLDVSSNTEWEVRSEIIDGEGWLNMEPSYGTGNGTLTGVLEMPDGVASCTILVRLYSLRTGRERAILVTGHSKSVEIPRDSTNMK